VRIQAEHFHRSIWAAIGPALDGSRRILELGCGSGDDARRLSAGGAEVVAVDVERHTAWNGDEARLTFVASSAERLPFQDESFDGVLARDSLHHVAEPGRALREIRRVLRRGAPAVIVEPNRFNPLFYLHMTRIHGHDHFSPSYLRGLLEATFDEAELSVVETRAYPFLPDRLMPTIRRWERLAPRLPVVRRLCAYTVAVCRTADPDRPVSSEAIYRGGILPMLQRRGLPVGFIGGTDAREGRGAR
jgi:SAM-dependent methyltransferase